MCAWQCSFVNEVADGTKDQRTVRQWWACLVDCYLLLYKKYGDAVCRTRDLSQMQGWPIGWIVFNMSHKGCSVSVLGMTLLGLLLNRCFLTCTCVCLQLP